MNNVIRKFFEWLRRRFSPVEVGRWLIAFIIFIASYFLWGCSETPVKEYYPVYKEVLTPVACGIKLPDKPKYLGLTTEDNLNLIKYALELKTDLKACIGGH